MGRRRPHPERPEPEVRLRWEDEWQTLHAVHDLERTWLLDLDAGETVVVGRSARCDIPVRAPRASRRHCRVVPAGDGHGVEDLGSTNGTTVNGAPFPDVQALTDGDVIDAGGCRMVYRT